MIDTGDVRMRCVAAGLVGGLVASVGCSTAGSAGPRAPTSAAAGPTATRPVCGVLIDLASAADPDRTAFLWPTASDAPQVRRYNVVNKTRHPAPLVVYAGWWMCVTAGKIIAEPGDDYAQYGTIEIADFTIDQFSPERGQE
ncbi:MAG: hypothetical protein IPL61_32205 [Myxococcales bacterium]|nr:hypothetical protein [Myxococcales bacterium]